MAVRFDADTEEYTRSLSLGTLTQFSIACWLKISVDRNNISTVWGVGNGGGDYLRLATTSNGTTLMLADDLGNRTIVAAGVNTWRYVGISIDGANGTAVTQAAGASLPTTSTWSDGAPSTNLASLAIGDDVGFTGQFLNGCVAAFKMWTGVLSEAELVAEALQYLPSRTDGLYAWYPLLQAETTDWSGNSRSLSGGSGASTEDGPPLRWGGGRTRIVVAGGLVSGELAATLPALGATADGDVTASGQPAITLPALTGQAAGELTAAGQADAVLPALTGALAGATTTPALLAATLPALTGSFEGELTGGFLTPTLPALTGQATGQLRVDGELTAGLPALTSDLAGHADIPHNNLDLTAGAPYRGWASRPASTDWGADTSSPAWAARSPAIGWTADTPARGWRARQPTT